MFKKKRDIHQTSIKLREIQDKINDEKTKRGYGQSIDCEEDTIRKIVKEILKLNENPGRLEVREYLMDIYENKELFERFMREVIKGTSEWTEPKRLKMTEIAIIENLNLLEKKKEKVKILDVGIGGSYSEELKAITTIELSEKLNEEKINFEMYGGDIIINEIELFEKYDEKINLFHLDVFKVKESMIKFHKEFGFNKFDVIRCSNLLGHFQQEKRNIIINNLIEMGEEKALILFNSYKEYVYTLFVKNKENIETRLIYP
jgi:2-polyprenyl-3-methyl-5-hydroxy-6-metoxy-1,4-benzoquinol methylase